MKEGAKFVVGRSVGRLIFLELSVQVPGDSRNRMKGIPTQMVEKEEWQVLATGYLGRTYKYEEVMSPLGYKPG